ncbi:hypothetical protein M501DRAFT_1023003 [Patellaria atrata CBS 101060]|uniref:SUZ domain-containing protein n=1 Tax=Patellaria atrata CBS 101060 TaxID=1346257 RepID=A0A9P4VP80_9PEZI|nr:hypothetical protein M501DRAFT_1023003 [Patellaria atrata CBS 101060]
MSSILASMIVTTFLEQLPRLDVPPLAIVTDDNVTNLSSSNSSGKPASVDGKSVASATTFALDEKESLRPDDSASLRAVEEEDVFSAPGSVVAGSRVGSDSGIARAFRDQLHEISAIGTLPQQKRFPHGRFPQTSVPPGISEFEVPPNPEVIQANPLPVARTVSADGIAEVVNPQPDEKLLEALESPRDRLFVVKLEQDIIDFVNNSKETKLDLPQCNAFYRMLAHRLADYYLLGHVVDPSMSAVQLFKTSYARMPPRLSGLSNPTSVPTPPLNVQARTIMRRANAGGGPSKTTSEAGGDSGSDDQNSKSKAQLTREEREAKYKEVRMRIFGDTPENENAEIKESTEPNDVSRSSSASGKKKSKKQRNNDDDGFEARSSFTTYYSSPQYAPGGYVTEATYYAGYPQMMAGPGYTPIPSQLTAAVPYNNGLSPTLQHDSQAQFPWQTQVYPSPNPGLGIQQYGIPNYELPADFQRGMQSLQSTSLNSQSTPKMPPSMPNFPDNYQAPQPQMSQAWPHMSFQQPYQMPQVPYGQQGYPDRAVPPSQGVAQNTYTYNSVQASPYQAAQQNRNHHPVPGSFNRQQFNPQSQAFVPGGLPAKPPVPVMNSPNMSGYNYQFPGQIQIPRQSPPMAQRSSFSSPRQPQNNLPVRNGNQGTSHPLPQPVSAPTSSQSTIAKWGTPSSLPPKPPPPVSMQPPTTHRPNLPNNPRLASANASPLNPTPNGGSLPRT